MPAEFNPVARVIDAYTAPSAPTLGGPTINAGGGWRDLASSLSQFNRALTPLLAATQDQLIEEDLAEGARIQQEHRVAFKDAVKKGLIPEGANPYLKLGYMKSELRLKGQEYQAFMLEEWQKDGAIQEADVEAIGGWAQERTANWRRQNLAGYSDVLVKEVFEPAQNSAQNQLMQHHISSSFQRTSERARDTLETEIAATAQGAFEQPPLALAQALGGAQGITDEATLRARYVASQTQAILDDAIANGMSPHDANRIALAQIGAIADLRGDREMLDALDHISTGSGSLGATTAAKQIRLQMEERIAAREIREENLFWTRQERQRSEARRAALSGAAKLGGPFDALAYYEASGSNDPELLSDLIRMDSAIRSSLDQDIDEDEVFALELEHAARTDPDFDPRKAIGAVQGNRIRLSTAQRIMGVADQSEESKRDPRISNPSVKALREGYGRSASSDVVDFGEGALNRGRSEVFFDRETSDYLAKNPEATEADVVNHMMDWTKKTAPVINSFLAPDEIVESPQAPQEEAQQGQEAPEQEAPEATPVADQVAPEQEQVSPAEQPQVQPAGHPRAGFPLPPPGAIAALIQSASDVNALNEFDAVFGPGAAAEVLFQAREGTDATVFPIQ